MPDAPSLREHFSDGLRVGEWFIEPMRNRIRRDEEEIQLEPKVMAVLLCLAKRSGKTVTKDQFKDEVWTETVVTDDVVSRCISQLRKVFDDDPQDPSYIETIRKTGYRLVAPVERPATSESESSSVDESTSALTVEENTNSVQRLLQTVTGRLRTSTTDVEDRWIVVAGGAIRREWVLGTAAVLAALLIFGVGFWMVANLSASGEAPLSAVPFTSFPGEEVEPALSSAGHQVAFAWHKPDSQTQNIYLIQRGAEDPLQLSADSTTDWSPAWSPDERFVAYVQSVDETHRVSIVPSIGGQPSVTLTLRRRDIESVAWLPSSSRRTLVVSAQRQPHQAFGLSKYFPDADSLASLTSPPLWSTGDRDPVPSPDGSQIAFVRSTVQGVEDIFVVPAGGGTPTQVTTDSTAIDGVAWGAEGSSLIYAAERGGVSGLWSVDAGGGDPVLLRSASEGTRFSHPTLSPETNRLVYTQRSAQLDVWKLRQPDQYSEFEADPLLSSTRKDADPGISPEGNRVAFVSDRSGTPEVWVAEVDGSSPTRLTSLGGPTIHTIRWSPDGTRLCFVARRGGQSNLHLISASGGPPSRLTKASSEDLVPRWSRNGRWIYFSSNRTEQWDAWRVRASADTHRVQQVTTGGAVAAQDSRTDSTLYYVRPDTVGIWRVALDTTRFPLQTTLASQSVPLNVILQFDPRERGSWWVGESGIHFLHRRSNRAVLSYFEFASRRILPLYAFSDWRPAQSIAVGPGGEWFAYTHVARRESDVMLVEEFE